MPKLSLHLHDSIIDKVGMTERCECDRPYDSLAQRLSHYVSIAAQEIYESVPALPRSDWNTILDAANGMLSQYERGPQYVFYCLWLNVNDAGHPELAESMLQRPLLEQAAVFEVVRAFWQWRGPIPAEANGDKLLACGARYFEE
jgi:hypothetical protein